MARTGIFCRENNLSKIIYCNDQWIIDVFFFSNVCIFLVSIFFPIISHFVYLGWYRGFSSVYVDNQQLAEWHLLFLLEKWECMIDWLYFVGRPSSLYLSTNWRLINENNVRPFPHSQWQIDRSLNTKQTNISAFGGSIYIWKINCIYYLLI